MGYQQIVQDYLNSQRSDDDGDLTITNFTPNRVKSQVVAGTNYAVYYGFGTEEGNQYVVVEIYVDLDGVATVNGITDYDEFNAAQEEAAAGSDGEAADGDADLADEPAEPEGPTEDELYEAAMELDRAYYEFLDLIDQKKYEKDDLQLQINDIEAQTEARAELEGFAQAAGEAADAVTEFAEGAYADRTEEFNTAQQAVTDFTGDDDTELQAALSEATKRLDRAESELQQLQQDAARALYQADRQNELGEMSSRVDEAEAQEQYFRDVIHYFNSKLGFFSAVQEALSWEDLQRQEGDDWWFYSEVILPEREKLWDMLYDLNNQLVDIQYQISDLRYEEFALRQRFAGEDEAAAQEDYDRQLAWFEEAEADADALREQRDAIEVPRDDEGVATDATLEEEWNELDNQLEPFEQEIERLQGKLNEFEEILASKKEEQQANEDARREAAEESERARALEAQERAAQDRQRERERAERDISDGHRLIDEWHRQIDELYWQMDSASTGQEYQAYEREVRALHEQIDAEWQYIDDLYNYVNSLHEQDQEHQRYLDGIAAEEAQALIEANQGRIDNMEAEERALWSLEDDARDAEYQMQRYQTPAEGWIERDESVEPIVEGNTWDRPEDWSEELAAEKEEAYYDLQSQVKQAEKHLKETRKMNDEANEAQWELDNQLRQQYDEVNWEWDQLIDNLFEAKANYEEQRLINPDDEDYIHQLQEQIWEAENRYWDAYHVVFEFRAEEQRDAAQHEDMWEVHDMINQAWEAAPEQIENSVELEEWNAQIPIAEEATREWERLDEEAWAKQDEWNNRDTDLDEDGGNDALQQELEEAQRLREEAEETRNQEEQLRGELAQAYHDMEFNTWDSLEQYNVDIWAFAMWGRDEELDDEGNVVVEGVEGLETRMRRAEKKLNEAIQAQQQADKAISLNKDPQMVWDLMYELRDAFENVMEKDLELIRIHGFYDALHEEFNKANDRRDYTLQQQYEAEVENAQWELDELNRFFEESEEIKDNWVERDELLRSEIQTVEARIEEINAEENGDASGQEEQLGILQGELDEHEGRRDELIQIFDEAQEARDEKIRIIEEAARQKELDEYNEMKQERDAAYYDLEALMYDEEGQVANFQHEADFWYQESLRALENDDFEYFKEANTFKEEIEKSLAKAEAKYQATVALFEVERIQKEARDLEEGKNNALAEFERRSGEREQAFNNMQQSIEDAGLDLEEHLGRVSDQQELVDGTDDTDPAKAGMIEELEALQDQTGGYEDAVSGLNDQLPALLLAQGLDQMYILEGTEYLAYEGWQAASDSIENSSEQLGEIMDEEPPLQEEWEAAKYELDRANNREEYESRREIFDDVNSRLNSLLDRKNTAQELYDEAEANIEQLHQDFLDATQAKEEMAQFILTEGNYTVDDYDPTEGPPIMPADPNDCTDERNECVWVTHVYDNPGYYTCGQVNVNDVCVTDGNCRVLENNECPDYDSDIDYDSEAYGNEGI